MKRLDPHVYLFTMGHFSVDWVQGAIPALLPYFITTCHLNYQDAATLIFANMLLASISQPLFGYYSDKISKPWFIPLGSLLCGLCMTALAFTQNYWLIFVFSMFSGLGSSIYHPEAARMVNKIAGPLKGQAMGSFSVGGNAGFAVGPLVAGFCAYAFDIRGLAVFGIVNTMIAIILFLSMPKVLHMVQDVTTAEKTSAATVTAENDWPAFRKLTVIIFVRSMCFTICNTFIPIYWIHILHAPATQGSMALTILFTMGVIVTFMGGVLADRFGFLKVLRGAMVLMVPTMFFFVNSTNIALSTLLLVPLALSLFTGYSPVVILGQTYLGKNVGFASGVTLGLSTTMGGLISPLVGWGADTWGIPTALQVLWIAAIIGAIFAFLIPVPKAWKHLHA